MQHILGKTFFDRDPVSVCHDLLGKFLVINKRGKIIRYMITDVEAYAGEEDEASHARHGKTERNAPMFGHPGYRYIYMIYGMYHMLNIVTGPGKQPSAILIRGLSAETTKRGNDVKMIDRKLDGPGKLTKALGITKSFNNKQANAATGLRIEDGGVQVKDIRTSPRVGIDYASDEWKQKHRRFYF